MAEFADPHHGHFERYHRRRQPTSPASAGEGDRAKRGGGGSQAHERWRCDDDITIAHRSRCPVLTQSPPPGEAPSTPSAPPTALRAVLPPLVGWRGMRILTLSPGGRCGIGDYNADLSGPLPCNTGIPPAVGLATHDQPPCLVPVKCRPRDLRGQ
jgi:hypothetical protein